MTLEEGIVSSIKVNGGNIVYEILGESGDLIVLTPGGRFSKEVPGLRPLAEALVDGGVGVEEGQDTQNTLCLAAPFSPVNVQKSL